MSLCLVWDLEYLEENKMTLEEKIKILTAYEEGKTVETYYRSEGKWCKINQDVWDFEDGTYRVKSDRDTKFKVGDTLVFKDSEEGLCPMTYTITDIDETNYKFEYTSPTAIEEVDKDFINERDVLWYFEIYDYISKEYSMYPKRITRAELEKEYASKHDTFRWKPIYALGFKLKEN